MANLRANELQAVFFKALAHPLRIRILESLKEKNSCVCDMADLMGEGQPQVSRALAQLNKAGLVVYEKRGTSACYRLKNRDVVRLLELSGNIIMDESRKVMNALNSGKEDE